MQKKKLNKKPKENQNEYPDHIDHEVMLKSQELIELLDKIAPLATYNFRTNIMSRCAIFCALEEYLSNEYITHDDNQLKKDCIEFGRYITSNFYKNLLASRERLKLSEKIKSEEKYDFTAHL